MTNLKERITVGDYHAHQFEPDEDGCIGYRCSYCRTPDEPFSVFYDIGFAYWDPKYKTVFARAANKNSSLDRMKAIISLMEEIEGRHRGEEN